MVFVIRDYDANCSLCVELLEYESPANKYERICGCGVNLQHHSWWCHPHPTFVDAGAEFPSCDHFHEELDESFED